MSDLKELIKSQILDTVVKGVPTESGWKVLIVDDEALRMISACCRMVHRGVRCAAHIGRHFIDLASVKWYDITDNGVAIVEHISKKRQPMVEFDAVYLCNPTPTNARLIKEDFSPKAKYKNAHIFFTDAAEDAVIAQLAHPALKAATRTVTELNMNFVPTEGSVFTLDMPNGLYEYYSKHSRNNRANIVANKIASLCAALGEIPVIRYSRTSAACEGLARQVQERVDMLAKYDDGMTRKKSQLLIMDRGEDMAAPLVHELSYQCAVYDFLEAKFEKDVYTHTFKDGAGKVRTKRLVLGDNDEIWDEFRHTHIAEVGEKVAKKFKDFQAETEANVVPAGDTPEEKQRALRAIMQSAPKQKKMTEALSLHLSIAAAITSGNPPEPAAFGKDAESCVQAEQNMLTGVDAQGKKVKSPVGELGGFISERGPAGAKLRALGVCVVAAGGLPDGELNRLYDLAEISFKDRKAVKNMDMFGIPVALTSRAKAARPRTRLEESGNPALTQYFTSRWTPVVKDFMIGAVTGSLDIAQFPAVKGMPSAMVDPGSGGEEVASARKGRRNWAKNRAKGEDDSAAAAGARKDRNRLIIFVPGAIGYNEIRCAYEMSKQYDVDVFIGSHTVSTPNQFVEKLKVLDEEQMTPPVPGVADALQAGEALQVVRGQTMPKATSSIHGI